MKASLKPLKSKSLRQALRGLFLAAVLFSQLARPGPVSAQSTSTRFETLSIEDGLSQSTVRAIYQDVQGFMWFGTDDGLNKYDGYTFTIYKHDPETPDSLIDNTITTIYQDTHGNLWIGTSNGLDRFDREKDSFKHFAAQAGSSRGIRGSQVSGIVQDQQGTLWVSTQDGGLSRFNEADNSFTSYAHDQNKPETLASDTVNTLLADQKGGIWVGTDAGLDFLDPKTGYFTHYQHNQRNTASLSDNQVLSLFQDRMGILWVGTNEGGLNRFNAAIGSFTAYQSRTNNPYTISSNQVRAIYEDKNGHLWVGGRNGLDQFNRAEEYFTHYQHDPNDQHSISNDSVLSIYADRSGVLWIGTFGGGLSKYVQNNERFALYQHRPGLPNSLSNDVVYAIYEDREEGAVWVGTMDGGLNRLAPEGYTFSAYQNNPLDVFTISSNDVRAITEDRLGVLWVGTYGGGLNRFDKDTGSFIHYTHDDNYPHSISDNRVTTLYEDRHGHLWVGTRSGGLDLLDPDTSQFTHFRSVPNDPTSLSNDYIHAIYEDRAGNLWIGTNQGISVMDPNTRRFRRYLNDPHNNLSLSDDRVLSILETSDGAIWIGTMLGGLDRFDPATQIFRHFTQKQGLPSDTVYGILADRNGYLWLSTNRGLSRFDPRSESFRNYDRQDGLQSYEFNPGAYFQNSRGRMYFGGIQGFNAFDPSKVEDNSPPPPVVVTAFKKFNQTDRTDLIGGEKINLSYQDNFVSFEFAALDYSAPEKNQYAYKLEGFDKDWIFSGTRRYASYTNLRGGRYTFRVIGSNQDGVWNETGASIEIVVVPPIWENGWFIGSLGLLLIGSAIGGYRLRMMNIQTRNRNLEDQIHDRTREIERRRQVAEGLREILAILNSDRSLKESLDEIILQIVRLMSARAVVIFRYGEEGAPVVVASNLFSGYSKLNEQAMPLLPGWLTLPLLEGTVLSLPDLISKLRVDPDLAKTPFGHYAALLAVPLIVNDKTDGGLVLLYDWAREFTEDDYQIAASFADHTALAIANAELRSQAEEIAVSAERSRLARDLHDAVTQTLFATSLIAEVLPKLWERNPQAGKQKVAEIRELTRGALAEMRTLLMELRPTALVDVPLPELLQQLCEAFTGRARVPVALGIQKDIDLPDTVKIGFYRIVQEALNNIQKHSRATEVEIHLCDNGEQVELTIHDNGIGFDKYQIPPNHFGLGIMDERARSIGAQFNLESQPASGTTICVIWKED